MLFTHSEYEYYNNFFVNIVLIQYIRFEINQVFM